MTKPPQTTAALTDAERAIVKAMTQAIVKELEARPAVDPAELFADLVVWLNAHAALSA